MKINQSYGIIKELMRTGYGDSSVAGSMGFEVGTDFPNPPDYSTVGRACHAYAKKVEDPSRLLQVVKNAVKEVRKERATLLIDVKL